MTNGINLFVAIALSYIIFIFYTNSTMKSRRNYLTSNMCALLGYGVIYIVSLYNIPMINIFLSVAVNIAIIYLCFRTTFKNAVIQSLILTAIMMISEGIAAMFTDINSEINGLAEKSLGAKLVHGVLSRLIYFTGTVIFKFVSKDKSKHEIYSGFLSLLVIPVFTILFSAGIMSIFDIINEKQRLMFALIAIFGVISNVIVYWMYDKTLIYQKEIRELQEQQFKDNMELMYCNMLEDKLDQAKIMRHDFREHLKILEAYIGSDSESALKYLKSIEISNESVNVINYTSSKVFNIMLSEKQKVCINKGILLKIQIAEVSLGFMEDIDIVSIFSNLLNNAIESSAKSEKKLINITLYKMNNSFLVIKIDNSCDMKPIQENGFYKTTKTSDQEHGIGLKSIVKTLKNYNGDLRLEYNDERRIFSAMIMIPLIY